MVLMNDPIGTCIHLCTCLYLVERQCESSINVQSVEDSHANHATNKVEIR